DALSYCKDPASRDDSETTLDLEKCPDKWRLPIRACSGRHHSVWRVRMPRGAEQDPESAGRNQGHWMRECSEPGCSHEEIHPSAWTRGEAVNAGARRPFERRLCGFRSGSFPKESLQFVPRLQNIPPAHRSWGSVRPGSTIAHLARALVD